MALEIPTNSSTPETDANTLILGEIEIDCAGASDVTLSDSQARNHRLIFSGVLTGNIAVIVPSEDKTWWIENDTSGAYTVTVKKSGGTGVAVTQGSRVCLGYSEYSGDVVAWSAEL